MGDQGKTVAVCGSTGHAGGATTRSLLEHGWRVRALTRKPEGKGARALQELGAELVEADMNQPASLGPAFKDVYGVFSVQNGLKSGFEREVAQGVNVADAAKAAGVRHLVYLSAGTGTPGTGIRSWDSKLPVEKHMRELGLQVTVLRPMAYMELMTDKAFCPAAGTWNNMPKLMGEDRPIPWIAVADIGRIAARAFDETGEFVGEELTLGADVRSLKECRALFEDVFGHPPRSFPLPVPLLDLFTRKDLSTMWRWLRANEVPTDTAPTRKVLPSALTVREWLETVRG